MFYWIYKDSAGQWRWRLYANNNRVVADSAESYHNKQDCLAGINLVKMSSGAPVREQA